MSDFSALYGIFKRCCNKILSYQFFKTLRSAPRSRYFISHRKQHTRKRPIPQAPPTTPKSLCGEKDPSDEGFLSASIRAAIFRLSLLKSGSSKNADTRKSPKPSRTLPADSPHKPHSAHRARAQKALSAAIRHNLRATARTDFARHPRRSSNTRRGAALPSPRQTIFDFHG